MIAGYIFSLLLTLGFFALVVESMTICDADVDKEFEVFKQKHHKKYESPEHEAERKKHFASNHRHIMAHNEEEKQGKHTYTLGHNAFSDMSLEEFRTRNGFKPKPKRKCDGRKRTTEVRQLQHKTRADLPASVDWRTKGYVTPVKNQGSCGTCWIFSAVAAIEGQYFKSTGNLTDLSEQQMLDCIPKPNCGTGGDPVEVYDKVSQEGGIEALSAYPNHAFDAGGYTPIGKCAFVQKQTRTDVIGVVNIPENDEVIMKEALALEGPLSVCIDAMSLGIMLYQDGIYNNTSCSQNTDHCVLAVGYGTSAKGHDYWIIKNSWGATWGMGGYINMSRNANNQCGIASSARYPVVGPKTNTTCFVSSTYPTKPTCQFPFKLNGSTFRGCTYYGDFDQPWCPLTVQANGEFAGWNDDDSNWAFCSAGCPMDRTR